MNGTAKCPKQRAHETVFHVPARRVIYHRVSSGRFAHQIRKYCEKAMYAQKTTKAKSSLPRSCRCSMVTACPSRPERRRDRVTRIRAASEPTREQAQT